MSRSFEIKMANVLCLRRMEIILITNKQVLESRITFQVYKTNKQKISQLKREFSKWGLPRRTLYRRKNYMEVWKIWRDVKGNMQKTFLCKQSTFLRGFKKNQGSHIVRANFLMHYTCPGGLGEFKYLYRPHFVWGQIELWKFRPFLWPKVGVPRPAGFGGLVGAGIHYPSVYTLYTSLGQF